MALSHPGLENTYHLLAGCRAEHSGHLWQPQGAGRTQVLALSASKSTSQPLPPCLGLLCSPKCSLLILPAKSYCLSKVWLCSLLPQERFPGHLSLCLTGVGALASQVLAKFQIDPAPFSGPPLLHQRAQAALGRDPTGPTKRDWTCVSATLEWSPAQSGYEIESPCSCSSRNQAWGQGLSPEQSHPSVMPFSDHAQSCDTRGWGSECVFLGFLHSSTLGLLCQAQDWVLGPQR